MDAQDTFAPPYISFETFRSFVGRLNPQYLPPRIDRSMMVGMAGGTQTYLLQALRSFELVGDGNETRPALVELASGDDRFKTALGELLERCYPEQLELARRQGTSAQLIESFAASGYSGSTVRKAVTFFLNAARAADAPLSPNFRAPTARVAAPRKATRPKPKTTPDPADGGTSPQGPAADERHTVELASGGTVTVSCSTAFLGLTREDREFLFDLVDRLRDYQAAHADAAPAAGAGPDAA